MSRTTSRLLLALAVLAVAPAALAAQKAARTLDTRGMMTNDVTSGFGASNRAPNIRPIGVGSSASSSLDDSDDALPSGHKVELWAVELRAGQTVRVTVRSSAFDTQVAVFDPENSDNAAANDDYEEGSTNSRVMFRAGRAGVFGILVAAYDAGERGSYSLEVMSSGDDENALALAPVAVKRIPMAKVSR
jgi:hypothetical protein